MGRKSQRENIYTSKIYLVFTKESIGGGRKLEKRKIAVGFMLFLVAFSMSSIALTTPAAAVTTLHDAQDTMTYYYPYAVIPSAIAIQTVNIMGNGAPLVYVHFDSFSEVEWSAIPVPIPFDPWVGFIDVSAAIYSFSVYFEVYSNVRGYMCTFGYTRTGWWQADALVKQYVVDGYYDWYPPGGYLVLFPGETIWATAKMDVLGYAWLPQFSFVPASSFHLSLSTTAWIAAPSPPPPPPPPGCPYLYVYNGSQYVNEGLLNIHANSDVTQTHVLTDTPAVVNGTYLLHTTEHWETISHINQVKLYATLTDGTTIQLPLISAVETQVGNVLPQLLFDDNSRTVELGAKWNNGTSQSIYLKFLALPSWIHAAKFTFVIIGYNPIPK